MQSQSGSNANFRLLVSDEPNDIVDFYSMNVTISRIGVLSADTDNWTEVDLPAPVSVDLTKLQGDNASSVWEGPIPSGNYTKVFVHVDNVTGILSDNVGGSGKNVTVKLPGGKLQISKPFTAAADGTLSFVFDITVIKAGESGKYILNPQVAESGAEKNFNDVTPSAPGQEKNNAPNDPKGRGKNR